MQITFKKLSLTNFKSHADLTVNFGEETKISGDNAKGKSSLIEAITWLLYGTNVFGSKLDPSPVTYEADSTKVSLLLSIDEKDILLERSLVNGKAEYAVNETPTKAKAFDALLAEYFSKDVFLSLFNPHYYFTLNWSVQRTMLLKYLTPPANKEVLAELPEVQAEKLAELIKQKSIDDQEATHKKNKTDKEKANLKAEGRVEALRGQLEGIEAPSEDEIKSLKAQDVELNKRLEEVDDELLSLREKNDAYEKKKAEVSQNRYNLDSSKAAYTKRYKDEVQEDCPTCKRPLDEETVKVVQEQKSTELASMKSFHAALIADRDRLGDELKELVFIEAGKLHEEASEISSKRNEIKQKLQSIDSISKLKDQLTAAESEQTDTLKSLNESIFILDAIKAFKAKEAELQGEKVQALFETLSVRLSETQKNGEIKPAFVIQLDGKDYNMLSLSESIRAGLEVREVLSAQAEIVAPSFVDNRESITRFKGPSGQLITSRVVADKELEVVAG